MDIPAMSDKNDLSETPLVNRDELRPHSLSIQIKDVEMLQRKIGNVEHEPSDDEDLDNEEYKEETVEVAEKANVTKSRNRRIDRIIRGSESNLEYTKKVIEMLETDRNPQKRAKKQRNRRKKR